MELNFEQVEGVGYVAEFTAESDFNLHMESGTPISAVLYQKSVEDGKYAVAAAINGVGNVLDTDISAQLYPKYIKIVSSFAVSNCHVTFAV